MPGFVAEYKRRICTVHARSRPFRLMEEYMSDPDREPCILLRHDVDRMPCRAVQVAKVESELGVRGTYYFRCTAKGEFPVKAISQISAQGHEVGYHYECLSRCNGDILLAMSQFQSNLETFRSIASCNTVSMHGKPMSQYENVDLLKDVQLG